MCLWLFRGLSCLEKCDGCRSKVLASFCFPCPIGWKEWLWALCWIFLSDRCRRTILKLYCIWLELGPVWHARRLCRWRSCLSWAFIPCNLRGSWCWELLSVLLSGYLIALDAHTLHRYILGAIISDHLVESHTLEITTKLVSDVHLTFGSFNVSSLFECSSRSWLVPLFIINRVKRYLGLSHTKVEYTFLRLNGFHLIASDSISSNLIYGSWSISIYTISVIPASTSSKLVFISWLMSRLSSGIRSISFLHRHHLMCLKWFISAKLR